MKDEIKETFHIAKLCLFTVRLQNDIGNDASQDVLRLLQRRVEKDRICPPVSTLHQGLFLSFAYICLVWLWELAKRDLDANVLAKNVGNRFMFAEKCKANGPRTVSTASDHLRLIRNAISHARVKVNETEFVFSDQDQKKESAPTSLTVSWQDLGSLSEAFLFAVNDLVYPKVGNDEPDAAADPRTPSH